MQKGGEGVQIPCKIEYILNERLLNCYVSKTVVSDKDNLPCGYGWFPGVCLLHQVAAPYSMVTARSDDQVGDQTTF